MTEELRMMQFKLTGDFLFKELANTVQESRNMEP